ncbi:MAG: hypothetical protein KDB14_20965 [Planctomycetales bacterium]|nr:hypothetical protein [Planctomycetales bacterium]
MGVGSAPADDLFEELTPVALEPALKSAEELRDERNRARKDQRRRLARRAKKAKSLGASLLMWLTTLAILVASIYGIRVIVVLGIPILLPMIMDGLRTSSRLLVCSLQLVILLATAIASLLGLLSVPLLLVRNPLGRSMAVATVLGGFVSSLLSIIVVSLALDTAIVPNEVIYSFVVQGIMLFILLSQAAQRYFDDAD